VSQVRTCHCRCRSMTSDFQLANDPGFRLIAFAEETSNLHVCCAAMSSYGEDSRFVSDTFSNDEGYLMAFGYKYLMVYLPDFSPESFLLFVHNPAGSTKLRDYSGEKQRVLGQPLTEAVLGGTILGETRFSVEEYRASDDRYWHLRTLEFNSRYLSLVSNVGPSEIANENQKQVGVQTRNAIRGRAQRGSRRQLQDYVNEHEEAITKAVMEALPPRLQELDAHIRWVSPIAQDDYAEYRDGDFISAVQLGDSAGELASFWPTGGPSWDALAIVSDSARRTRSGVILVEAKSHISEIYGNGCQAGLHSRDLIEKALTTAKEWCGANTDADWTGSLYQSANRLAHLYFIRERLKCPAWLVNVYFVNDPIGPAERDTWTAELQKVKRSLGLTHNVPFTIDLFLPALNSAEVTYRAPGVSDDCEVEGSKSDVAESGAEELHAAALPPLPQQSPATQECDAFATWANRWMTLANYDGPLVPDVSHRIEQLVRQWREPIAGSWQRGADPQLLEPGRRYRRGDLNAPHPGEHTIESEILCQHFDRITCFGNRLIDGINALPLVRDAGGARHANVEADLFLLTEHGSAHRLFLCEVKSESNNAWYAAVESLRQFRLLMSSPASLCVFARRLPSRCLTSDIPVTALVLAPPSFYSSRGKKGSAVEPTLKLLGRLKSEFAVDARLAVWDAKQYEIRDWRAPIE